MDFSLFASGGVELAPRKKCVVHDVALTVVKAPKYGVQLQVLMSASAAKGFGKFASVTWFPGGGLRVAPGGQGQFAMRHSQGSSSCQLRFTAPPDFLAVRRQREPVEWQRQGDALLIVVPPSWLHDAAGAREEAMLSRLCDDPETAPPSAPVIDPGPTSPAKVARKRAPKATVAAPATLPEDRKPPAPIADAVPVAPATYSHAVEVDEVIPDRPKREDPPPRPEPLFEVIRLGLAHVRTTDLPVLRDLAAGKSVDDANLADWRRLREQLRDVQVLMPIGGGKLVPQGRAVLDRLLRAYDKKMSEAG
jgi:hypothetical protein